MQSASGIIRTRGQKLADGEEPLDQVSIQELCSNQASQQQPLISEDLINRMDENLQHDLRVTEDADEKRDIVCKHVRSLLVDFESGIRSWITDKFDAQGITNFDTSVRCDKIDELEKDLEKVRESGVEYAARVVKLEECTAELRKDVIGMKASLEAQEMYSRRNSVRIYGITEPAVQRDDKGRIIRENTNAAALNVFNDSLGLNLSAQDIDRTHRVGLRKKNSTTPRAIIVKFVRHDVKDSVVRNRYKLAGTSTVIREDLTSHRMKWLSELRLKDVSYKDISTYDGNFTVETHGPSGTDKHSIRSDTDFTKLLSILEAMKK